MYETFFGLSERPFELAPNPRFLLLTPRHAEALSNLEYGVTGRKGITVLLGEAGTGKTTVIRTALQRWDIAGHKVAYINNPTLTRDEFVERLAQEFELGAGAATSKTRLLSELTALVMSRHEKGQSTGLLIDEAQSLPDELLEEIRLLANIETAEEKVFPVVLAGQPELAERLNTVGLRQLKQRVGLRCVLSPLDVKESASYIAGRIRLAGGVAGQLFTREAVMAVHEGSRGIPRVINVICDNALLAAFAANRKPISSEMVAEVCRDFDLEKVATDTPPSVQPVAVHDSRALDTLPAENTPRVRAATNSMFEGSRSHSGSDTSEPGAPPEDRMFATSVPKRRFLLFG